MKMRLTEREFIDYLELYKKMYDEETQILNSLGTYEWKPSDWLLNFYNLLSDMCDLPVDDNFETLLDWWCFTTNFGKENNIKTSFDGKEFQIVTAKNLYDFIMSEN